eukprot:5052909-Prymnesium_polylepis.3
MTATSDTCAIGGGQWRDVPCRPVGAGRRGGSCTQFHVQSVEGPAATHRGANAEVDREERAELLVPIQLADRRVAERECEGGEAELAFCARLHLFRLHLFRLQPRGVPRRQQHWEIRKKAPLPCTRSGSGGRLV